MIRLFLMITGLLLSAANLPIIFIAVASYYIFVRLTASHRPYKDYKPTSDFSKKIVYIDHALLLSPILIYFLHPDTDKEILLFMWAYFKGWLSLFFH
jgi:hypothetical protein